MIVLCQPFSSALLNQLGATGDQALVAITNEVDFGLPAGPSDQAIEDAVHALGVTAARQHADAGELLLRRLAFAWSGSCGIFG